MLSDAFSDGLSISETHFEISIKDKTLCISDEYLHRQNAQPNILNVRKYVSPLLNIFEKIR